MYYRCKKDSEGDFVAADGTRYSISGARRIRNQEGVNSGYCYFSSLEEALLQWGLKEMSQEPCAESAEEKEVLV